MAHVVLDEARQGLLRKEGCGALIVPHESVYCHIWRGSGRQDERPGGGWDSSIEATLFAPSPTAAIGIQYVASAPTLEIGDRCGECGEIWMERPLFGVRTFVGCLC